MSWAARIPTLGGDLYPGASLALDFLRGSYKTPAGRGSFASLPNLTVTRATPSVAYGTTVGGVLVPFAANVARITDQGLLVEEARTNLLLRSQDWSASWSNVQVSQVSNAATAPDGTVTASALTGTGTDGLTFQRAPISASTTYTASLWAKVPSGTLATKLQMANQSGSTVGSVVSVTLTTSWQRVIVTATTGVGDTTAGPLLGGFTTIGTGQVIHVWGGQLELGAFATSYVPTVASSVTRAADGASIAGLSTGTAYTLMGRFLLPNSVAGAIDLLNLGPDASNLQGFYAPAGTQTFVLVAGVTTANVNASYVPLLGVQFSMAGRFQTNDVNSSAAGLIGTHDTSTAPASLSTLNLSAKSFGGVNINGYIQKAVLYPTAMSDAQLQALTT